MPNVFDAKVRKLGNSLAVIVPNSLVKETGTRDGETVKVLIMTYPHSKRTSALERFAGKNIGKKPFVRDRRDRV